MDLRNHHRPFEFIDFWAWMFPLTYLIHIAEEYWGGEGYPAFILRVRGVHLTPARFWMAQTIGALLMVAGVMLARRFNFLHMMVIIMAAIVLVNGLTHAFTSASTLTYGPGLFSSVLIWIPFGLATLIKFRNELSKARYWGGIAIGVGVNVLVGVITMRGGRLM